MISHLSILERVFENFDIWKMDMYDAWTLRKEILFFQLEFLKEIIIIKERKLSPIYLFGGCVILKTFRNKIKGRTYTSPPMNWKVYGWTLDFPC